MRSLVIGTFLIGVLLLVANCSSHAGPRTVDEVVDDSVIVRTINYNFSHDPEIDRLSIEIECQRGVVTLSGSVPSEDVRQKAVELAWKASGVREVHCRITIEK